MNPKSLAIILIIAIILNLILFAVGFLNQLGFWAIVIVIAFIAYKVIPNRKV